MKHFFARSLLLAGMMGALFVACNKESEVLAPVPALPNAVAAPSLAEVQDWYRGPGGGKAPGAAGAHSQGATQSKTPKELAIN